MESVTCCDRAALRLEVIREPAFTRVSDRKREVCRRFGIAAREAAISIARSLRLRLRTGSITLLLGPSGSGKSSILSAIGEQTPGAIRVERAGFARDKAIIDCIMPGGSLQQALQVLTACGLGEARLWLRAFDDLSEGEQFRARLARSIGEALEARGTAIILCDEFASGLHRRAARAIAFNLRKLISRTPLTLCVASSHDDILEDLRPDQLVRLGGAAPSVEDCGTEQLGADFLRNALIEPGTIRDYDAFGGMHYRRHDALGFVDKVFVLRERDRGDPLGIAVFAHGSMELAMRNLATRDRFKRNLRRLNRELRILRRLVIHPDVRGCGLGHWLVRQTLPRVGVRFVECLAAMGAIHPVFERAGMEAVGPCPLPRGRLALLRRMRELKLDPFAEDLDQQIASNPRVRGLVEKTLADWSARVHSARNFRIEERRAEELCTYFRQLLGEPPMYYLWDREGEFPQADYGRQRE